MESTPRGDHGGLEETNWSRIRYVSPPTVVLVSVLRESLYPTLHVSSLDCFVSYIRYTSLYVEE